MGTKTLKMVGLGMVLLAALAGAGCASVALPQDQVHHYQESVALAEKLGALKLQASQTGRGGLGLGRPKAHLLLAADQMVVAQQMADHGDSRAPILLARAQSDVDLAIELTREATVRAQLVSAQAQAVPTGAPAALTVSSQP